MNNLLEAARRYHAAGLNVLPAIKSGKRPIGSWKQWTKERPDFDAVFPAGLKFDALCVVCGPTSGNLEIIDFDQKAAKFDGWAKQLPADLVNSLPTETTQSDGRHVAYRCETVEKNKKLARNADGTTIETRGTGGICLINPTDGYSSIWGDWESIPTITPEQRARLLDAARACDEPQTEKPKKGPTNATRITNATPAPAPTFTGESVADFLRSNLDIVRQALTRAGWEFLRDEGDFEQWQRPNQPQAGKLGGSLCTNPQSDGYGCFHCFTSNAAPLEVEGNYSPLQLIAALEHGGNESAASKAYAPNRRNLSIVELLDPDEVHYSQSLEMNAEGVTYSARSLRDACIQRQRERLERQAEKRAAATLEEIDVEALNKSFPLKALPDEMQPMTQTQGDQYGTPYATIAAAGLSALSGVLGCDKAEYSYNGIPVNPLIHTFIVAPKGAGKSETVNAFLNPIANQIERPWNDWTREQQRNKTFLDAEWKKLERQATLTDEEQKRQCRLSMTQRLIEWGGERIRLGAGSSIEALWYQSAMNRTAAELDGRKQHGIVFTLGDASKLVKTNTRKADEDAALYWARANAILDFNETPQKAVTDKGRETAKGGAAWILDVQPKHCHFVLGGDTLAGGFDRRFLWVTLPSKDMEERPQTFNLESLQAPLISLYFNVLNWNGGKFDCGYKKEYDDWYTKQVRFYNQIRSDDEDLAAYLKTQFTNTIHRLTLLLHCCECVQTGNDVKTIAPKTFQNAAQLVEAYTEHRILTWKIMKNAVEPSKQKTKERTADAPKALVELSEQSRKTYWAVCAIMRKTGRGASITEINEKVRAYRRQMDRKAIDAELLDAGLMYIDPETTKNGNVIASGERVAVPVYNLDSFSGDLVESPADESPADEEPTTNSPFWK